MAHLQIPELYYLLFGLALGQPMRAAAGERALSVERVWAALWGAAPARQSPAALAARISLCGEAACALLAAARALAHADDLPAWLADHATAIVQVPLPTFFAGRV